jgi:hypothetical protein
VPQALCPECGGVLPLSDDQFDRAVECGRCGRVFVPADEPADRPDPDELPPRRATSPAGKKAVAGLVLGVIGATLSVSMFCFPFVALPFGVTGIVFGILGRRSENPGLAVGGIATGAAAILVSTFGSLIWLLFALG